MSASTVLYTVAPKVSGVKANKQKVIIDTISPVFYSTLKSWGIDTKQRIACFIGQTMEEADGYTTTIEFANGSEYQGRMGNTSPGDGKKYKGRGFIQLTGKNNYKDAAKDLGMDVVNHPELLEDPVNALKVSCWFWKKYNLNKWADADNITALGNAINRGNPNYKGQPLGASTRLLFTNKAKKALENENINTLPSHTTTTATGVVSIWAVAMAYIHQHWIPLTLAAVGIITAVAIYEYLYKGKK